MRKIADFGPKPESKAKSVVKFECVSVNVRVTWHEFLLILVQIAILSPESSTLLYWIKVLNARFSWILVFLASSLY